LITFTSAISLSLVVSKFWTFYIGKHWLLGPPLLVCLWWPVNFEPMVSINISKLTSIYWWQRFKIHWLIMANLCQWARYLLVSAKKICALNIQDIVLEQNLIRFIIISQWQSTHWIVLAWKSYWRGRLNTIDLLVLINLDQLLLELKLLFTFFTKQPTLLRRSIILSLPPQLVFHAQGLSAMSKFGVKMFAWW